MRRALALGVGLALAVAVWAAALGGPSPTGPTKPVKEATPLLEGLESPPDGVDWLSRSEEEAVAALVHDPVKFAGLRGLTSEAQIELKALMQRTEARIRDVFGAEARGELRPAVAREALEEAVADYRRALGEISSSRWPAGAPPR